MTPVTVTLNEVATVNAGNGVPESVNNNVTCTGPPFCSANGVTVTKQFGAVPVITTPDTGITAVFDEETVMFAEVQATVESTSSIVNGRAAVAVSSLIV